MVDPVAETYLPILILGTVSVLLVFATLFVARLLGPRNPTDRKLTTYESGEITQGIGRGPIAIQYYPYILVFLILDIEVLFLTPFAVRFLELGLAGTVEMALFVALLLLGWLYAIRKGVLTWVR